MQRKDGYVFFSSPLPPPHKHTHLGHILDDGGPQQVHEVCGGDHSVSGRDLHPGGQDEHIAQGNEGTGAVLILREREVVKSDREEKWEMRIEVHVHVHVHVIHLCNDRGKLSFPLHTLELVE